MRFVCGYDDLPGPCSGPFARAGALCSCDHGEKSYGVEIDPDLLADVIFSFVFVHIGAKSIKHRKMRKLGPLGCELHVRVIRASTAFR